tara:strand:- start:625 stop:936 length:312 start_codon:yes stop_codon:yes gene_type:complete
MVNLVIRISGKYSTKKHANSLRKFIQEELSKIDRKDNVQIETVVDQNFNFNILLNDTEIFSKRNFWNKYPDYKNILKNINEKLNEKDMYAAMKAAYDFNNELF